MASELSHDPRRVEPRRQLHLRRAPHALKGADGLDGMVLQRFDDAAHEQHAAVRTITGECLSQRQACLAKVPVPHQRCGTCDERRDDAGLCDRRLGVCGCGSRPFAAHQSRLGDRRMHVAGRFTARQRRVEFGERLVEVAGVPIGNAQIQVRARLAAGVRARDRLQRPRIECEVHVDAREVRIQLQCALCCRLRCVKFSHVTEHEREQVLGPGRRLVDLERALEGPSRRLGLAATIQNLASQCMHRHVLGLEAECTIEPCGGAIRIAEGLFHECHLAQRDEVVRRAIEQLAEHRRGIGRPTKSRVPLAQRQCGVDVVRRLAQPIGELLHALGVDRSACRHLLQVLRRERHARIDIQRALEAGRGLVREATPGQHHAAIVLRAGVGDGHALRDGAQPVGFADRQLGHRLLHHRHGRWTPTPTRG